MSSYILNLRKTVGHAPLLQCGASVIVENERGEILLGRRTDNHKWGYAGGSVELGESAEDCARRELREETGLIAGELELFCVNSGAEAHYVYPNGDEAYNVEIVCLCRNSHGELRHSDEMTELRFFALEEIPEEISDPIRPVVRRYIEMRKKEEGALCIG